MVSQLHISVRQWCLGTLIDRRNFHLFQPLLYQVATGTISAPDISAPVRSIFGDKKNVTIRLDIANGIDPYNRYVQTKNHSRIRYDDLIIATGVSHHYFGHASASLIIFSALPLALGITSSKYPFALFISFSLSSFALTTSLKASFTSSGGSTI